MIASMLANADMTELIAIGIILVSSLIGSLFKKPKPRDGKGSGRPQAPSRRSPDERVPGSGARVPAPPVPRPVARPRRAADARPVPRSDDEESPVLGEIEEPSASPAARSIPRMPPPGRRIPGAWASKPKSPAVAPVEPAPVVVEPSPVAAAGSRPTKTDRPAAGADLRRALAMMREPSDLRAAFILTEILAPPVACRDNPHF